MTGLRRVVDEVAQKGTGVFVGWSWLLPVIDVLAGLTAASLLSLVGLDSMDRVRAWATVRRRRGGKR